MMHLVRGCRVVTQSVH